MNATNELLIRISPEEQRIRLESNENGVIACKEIAPEAMLDCIKSGLQNKRIDSGFLPSGCFHVGMNSNGIRDYCLWHPERYADVSYYGTKYARFPLPRLVFGFELNQEGKVFSCHLGVVEDGPLTENAKMFVYPFSNVGGFGLCVGNNALPVYKNIHTLATLPGYLLRLPNNNDSFHAKNNRLHMQYRDLLEHLKDKDPAYYYTDVLLPSGKTLKDFISGR